MLEAKILSTHFYNRLKRKYVTLFGSLFNDITFIRYNSAYTTEIERIKVPIAFAPKEKWMVKLRQDPDLVNSTQISLPRMSFNVTSMMYDPSRKQQSLLKMPTVAGIRNSQYVGVPYDIIFELSIMTRNLEDGDQIMEQILPMFNPDYTASTNLMTSMGYIRDIPIILNDVQQELEWEDDFETTRSVINSFTFTMKVDFWGPINTGKIIRKVYANTYIDTALTSAGNISKMNISGNGKIRIEDVAYQGDSIKTATAAGIVLYVNTTNTVIEIGATQGNFLTNNTIRLASTNAAYNLVSFDAAPRKVVNITVVPDPINAEPEDDYGYSTYTTEY